VTSVSVPDGYIYLDVDLATCTEEPLTFDGSSDVAGRVHDGRHRRELAPGPPRLRRPRPTDPPGRWPEGGVTDRGGDFGVITAVHSPLAPDHPGAHADVSPP